MKKQSKQKEVIMKNSLVKCLVAGAAVACLGTMTVQAIPITGGISLAGNYTVGGGDLNVATAFTAINNVQVTSVGGNFAGVGITLNTPGSVVQNTFSFNPFPGGGLVPLWYTVSGTAASFDLISLTSLLQPGDNTLTLKGTGILHLASYDNTPGSWVFTANQTGGSFSFSSSNGSVPDGGTTVLLLGLAMGGLGFAKRYLTK